jgi:hypothetical protein
MLATQHGVRDGQSEETTHCTQTPSAQRGVGVPAQLVQLGPQRSSLAQGRHVRVTASQ